MIADNFFSDIHITHAVVYVRRRSGVDNQLYGNKFYNIDGSLFGINTAGTKKHGNEKLPGLAPAAKPLLEP